MNGTMGKEDGTDLSYLVNIGREKKEYLVKGERKEEEKKKRTERDREKTAT